MLEAEEPVSRDDRRPLDGAARPPRPAPRGRRERSAGSATSAPPPGRRSPAGCSEIPRAGRRATRPTAFPPRPRARRRPPGPAAARKTAWRADPRRGRRRAAAPHRRIAAASSSDAALERAARTRRAEARARRPGGDPRRGADADPGPASHCAAIRVVLEDQPRPFGGAPDAPRSRIRRRGTPSPPGSRTAPSPADGRALKEVPSRRNRPSFRDPSSRHPNGKIGRLRKGRNEMRRDLLRILGLLALFAAASLRHRRGPGELGSRALPHSEPFALGAARRRRAVHVGPRRPRAPLRRSGLARSAGGACADSRRPGRRSSATIDFGSLGVEGRIDWILLQNRLAHDLRLLDREEKTACGNGAARCRSPGTILGLADARRRLEPVNPQAAAQALAEVARQIEKTQKAVEAGLPPDPAKAGAAPAAARADRSRVAPAHPHRRLPHRGGAQGTARGPREVVPVLRRVRPALLLVVRGALQEDRRGARKIRPVPAREGRRRQGGRGRAHRRRPDRARGDRAGPRRRVHSLFARAAHRDRRARVRVVRGGDEEGLARDGLRRRLEEGPREGQDAVRRAGQAGRADRQPPPRGRRPS